jgi:hypothetical protein
MLLALSPSMGWSSYRMENLHCWRSMSGILKLVGLALWGWRLGLFLLRLWLYGSWAWSNIQRGLAVSKESSISSKYQNISMSYRLLKGSSLLFL